MGTVLTFPDNIGDCLACQREERVTTSQGLRPVSECFRSIRSPHTLSATPTISGDFSHANIAVEPREGAAILVCLCAAADDRSSCAAEPLRCARGRSEIC